MTFRKLWTLGWVIVGALALAGCGDDGTTTVEPPSETIDTTAPNAPTGLGVDPVETTLLVEWEANSEPDLAGYVLERSLDRGVTWTAVSETMLTDESYTDTYHSRADYRVSAVDSADNQSAASAVATYVASTDGNKYPEDPAGQS